MGIDLSFVNKGVEYLPAYMDEAHFKAIEELLKTYNPLTGPVQQIITYYGTRTGSPVYVGHGEYYNLDNIIRKVMDIPSFNFDMKNTLFAGGRGTSLHQVFLSSLSETIERLMGTFAFLHKDNIIYGTYKTLSSDGANCIHPDMLPLFANEQYTNDFSYSRFTENSYLGWIKGKRLISNEEMYVPAQLVTIFYLPKSKEEIIGYATSGGLASHVTKEDAIYNGVCELIERDAVNIRWVCRIPPEIIEIDKDGLKSFELREVANILERTGLKLRFYYHSMDIKDVNVVSAIVIQNDFKKYSFLSGSGADIDIETAILKSITEFTQTERHLNLALFFPDRQHSKSIDRVFGIKKDAPIDKIDSFFKTVVYYGYAENLRKLDWYLNENKNLSHTALASTKLNKSKERYDFILNVIKNNHIDPICFDFTPTYFKSLKIMKVFAHQLTQPFIASYPLLGNSRYLELPQKMGIVNEKLTYKDLVKDPHPYP